MPRPPLSRLAAAVLLAATLTMPAATLAAEPITKLQARDLPDSVVKRRVLDQLEEVLVPEHPSASGKRPPKHALTDLWFHTRPHATHTPGVCESDSVVFHFRGTAFEGEGAARPVKVASVTAQPRYHLFGAVDPDRLNALNPEDELVADAECAKLNPRSDRFVGGREDDVVSAIWQLRSAIRQAKASTRSLQVSCDGFKTSCDSVLAGLDPANVDSVDPCEERSAPAYSPCLEADVGDISVRLIATQKDPSSLSQVVIGQLVIIADARAD